MRIKRRERVADQSSTFKSFLAEPSALFTKKRFLTNNFTSTVASRVIKPSYVKGLFKHIDSQNKKKSLTSFWGKKVLTLVSILANFISIALYLYSSESDSNYGLMLIELCINVYFLGEYACTIGASAEKLVAVTKWSNLVDLLSIVGGFLSLLNLTEVNLGFLRVIKIVRVSRVLRLLKYITEIRTKGDNSKQVYYNYGKRTVTLIKFYLNVTAFYFIFTGILGFLMDKRKSDFQVNHLIYIVFMKLSTVGAVGPQSFEPVFVVGISVFIALFLGFSARLYLNLCSLKKIKHIELRKAYNLSNHVVVTGFFSLERLFDFMEDLINANAAHLPILLSIHDTQMEIIDCVKNGWLAGRAELLVVDYFNYSFYKMANLKEAHSIFLLNHTSPWTKQSPFINLLNDVQRYSSLQNSNFFVHLNPITTKFFSPKNGICITHLNFTSSLISKSAIHPGFHSLIGHLNTETFERLHVIDLPSKFINLNFSVVCKFILREANRLRCRKIPLFIGLIQINIRKEIEYIKFNPKDTVILTQMGIFIAECREELENLLESVRMTDFASLSEPATDSVQFSSMNNKFLFSNTAFLKTKNTVIRGEILKLQSIKLKLKDHTVIFTEDNSYIEVVEKLKKSCPFERVLIVADFTEERVTPTKTYPDVFFLCSDCSEWALVVKKSNLFYSSRVIVLRTDWLGSLVSEYCAAIYKLTVKVKTKFDSDISPFSQSKLVVEDRFVDKALAFSFRDKLRALVLFALLQVDFDFREEEQTETFDTIKLRNSQGLSYSEVIDNLLRKGAICLGIKEETRFDSEIYKINPDLDFFVKEDAEILVMGSFEFSENDSRKGETRLTIKEKVKECTKETKIEKFAKSTRRAKRVSAALKEALNRLSCQ